MANYREIAAIAGVSKSTVALAMRNDPRCCEATRQHVQRTAQVLGYRPNPLVSIHMAEIRRNRPVRFRETIAWLTHLTPSDPEWGTSNYQGAAQRAEELGFRVEAYSYPSPSLSQERLSQILIARGTRGIVVGSTRDADFKLNLAWQHFAAVAIGYTLASPQLHRVCLDHFHGVQEIHQRLRSVGYRRVGLAMPESLEARNNHFVKAGHLLFQDGLQKSERVPHLVTRAWSESVFHTWFERHRPDAIITVFRDLIEWLHKLNLRVPEDVGVATIFHGPATKGISGLRQRDGHMGVVAVDLLVGQLHNNDWGIPAEARTVLLPGEWYQGATTCVPESQTDRSVV